MSDCNIITTSSTPRIVKPREQTPTGGATCHAKPKAHQNWRPTTLATRTPSAIGSFLAPANAPRPRRLRIDWRPPHVVSNRAANHLQLDCARPNAPPTPPTSYPRTCAPSPWTHTCLHATAAQRRLAAPWTMAPNYSRVGFKSTPSAQCNPKTPPRHVPPRWLDAPPPQTFNMARAAPRPFTTKPRAAFAHALHAPTP